MIPLPALLYTLGFLTRGELVLMLQRARAPNRGLWNGVGGHIEPGETPTECMRREVQEETGYHLADGQARFRGILTWEGFEIPAGGLYLFTAEAPLEWGEPHSTDEGPLAWKPRPWVFSSPEVVDNLHVALPPMLDGAPPQAYHFVYRAGVRVAQHISPLPEGIII